MPARAHDEPEAVACGFRGADPPACRRGAGFQRRRRPQQKERQSGIGGGELQTLAGSEIELVDGADDGSRGCRVQRFLDRPQGLFALRGFDQDQPAWIESKRVEAVTVKPAKNVAPLWAVAISRCDPNQRAGFWQTTEHCRDEPESRCGRTLCFGHDFMQATAGQTTLRQMGIEGGKTEWQTARQRPFEPLQARQQAA